MPILGIASSASTRAYSLLETVTTVGSPTGFTVPDGITQIALFLIGPGGNGQSGESASYWSIGSGAGGAGGAGGPGIAFKDLPVSTGQIFTVSVGSLTGSKSGGPTPSTFTSLSMQQIANSGYATGQNTFVAGSCIVPGYITAAGKPGANGGGIMYNTGNGLSGGTPSSPNVLTLNLTGLGNVSVNAGGPGGGGGGGAMSTTSGYFVGGIGGSGNGTQAGSGGFAQGSIYPIAGDGNSALFTTGGIGSLVYGAGGAGGGGGGWARSAINGIIEAGAGGSFTTGTQGVVYIYGR